MPSEASGTEWQVMRKSRVASCSLTESTLMTSQSFSTWPEPAGVASCWPSAACGRSRRGEVVSLEVRRSVRTRSPTSSTSPPSSLFCTPPTLPQTLHTPRPHAQQAYCQRSTQLSGCVCSCSRRFPQQQRKSADGSKCNTAAMEARRSSACTVQM